MLAQTKNNSKRLYFVKYNVSWFCFQVVMDTINVIVRTTVFTLLVLWWPQGAVVAFSAAQVIAVIVYSACYYFYFSQYLAERRAKPVASPKKLQRPLSSEDDFPFTTMAEFLPRRLENQVSLKLYPVYY